MIRRTHLICLCAMLATLTCSFVYADDSAEIAVLKQRVAALEKKVAELEAKLASAPASASAVAVAGGGAAASAGKATPDDARAARRAMFNKRMAQDQKKYTRQQLGEAEQLYQVANKDWSSPQAKDSLQKMIDKYPDVNRTGCAVLYLGQMSEGDDAEKYLKLAIDKHSDCMYGDGVQVGAYARFLLGQHYAAKGEKDKAKELFNQILQQYPDAVDHPGRPLAPQVEVFRKDL